MGEKEEGCGLSQQKPRRDTRLSLGLRPWLVKIVALRHRGPCRIHIWRRRLSFSTRIPGGRNLLGLTLGFAVTGTGVVSPCNPEGFQWELLLQDPCPHFLQNMAPRV